MRLVTFNILHGRSLRDGQVDTGRLAEVVRRLDPDVLALQEVDRLQERSHRADLTDVAAAAMGAVDQRFVPALAGTPGAEWAPPSDPDDPGTAGYGVSLLSRYPATAWRVLRLPRIPFRVPRTDHHRWPRRLAREEPRVAVAGRFETPDGPLTAVSTHLSFVPGWGQLQLLALRRALAGVAGPVVLMGDLNLAGRQPELLTGYRALGRRPTMPADHPSVQIDHILLRGRLGAVRSVENPEVEMSDHRPLVVELGPRRG
ncbi:endonuclease/exonuclease/phosphatase family protein [Microlunatus lacustris]